MACLSRPATTLSMKPTGGHHCNNRNLFTLILYKCLSLPPPQKKTKPNMQLLWLRNPWVAGWQLMPMKSGSYALASNSLPQYFWCGGGNKLSLTVVQFPIIIMLQLLKIVINSTAIAVWQKLCCLDHQYQQRFYWHQGSHGHGKSWKKSAVMEKSWNMKISQKVMEKLWSHGCGSFLVCDCHACGETQS